MRRAAQLVTVHGLETAVVAVVVALPLVAVVERRVIELVLPVLAVPMIALFAMTGRTREVFAAWSRWFATPVGAAGLATLAWMAASPLWSPDPRLAALGAVKALGLVAAALLLAVVLDRIGRDRLFAPLTIALAVAGLLMALENASGGAVHRAFGYGLAGDMQAYHYTDRGDFQLYNIRQQATGATMVAALLLWPCAGWLVMHGRRAAAAALIGLVWIVGMLGTSGAALLGLLAGTAVLALGLLQLRAAIALLFAEVAGSLLLAPVAGPLLRVLSPSSVAVLAEHHAAERVEMWADYAALWPLRPLIGFGFHAVKFLGTEAKRAVLLPGVASALDAPHPHDMPIQILFEFGAVGVALVVIAAAVAAYACWRKRDRFLPFVLAMAATLWGIALVDNDLWYPWWGAIMAVAVVLAARLVGEERESSGLREAPWTALRLAPSTRAAAVGL